MPIYGAIRCRDCFKLFESKSDYLYHLTTDHRGQHLDEHAAYVIPSREIAEGMRLHSEIRAAKRVRELVDIAPQIDTLSTDDPLHVYWLSQYVSFYLDRCLTTHASSIVPIPEQHLEPLTARQRNMVSTAVDHIDDYVLDEVPATGALATMISAPVYNRLMRWDMDESSHSSVVVANRAMLCAQVFKGLEDGSAIADELDEERVAVVAQLNDENQVSKALWTDGRMIMIQPCPSMRRLTGMHKLLTVRGMHERHRACFLIVFDEGHRMPLALTMDGQMEGFPLVAPDARWYVDALHCYLGQIVLQAVITQTNIASRQMQEQHRPGERLPPSDKMQLSTARYERVDMGGSHLSPRTHHVRPHLRYVRDGYVMDEARKREAQRHGLPIKPGHTLVSGHDRGLIEMGTIKDARGGLVYKCQASWADHTIEGLLHR